VLSETAIPPKFSHYRHERARRSFDQSSAVTVGPRSTKLK
jgi:hypothetical protein